MERDRYPNVLDALRHPSLKTPPRYELCQIDSGDERARYDHSLDGKMFCVGTSDEEDSAKGKRDQGAHRSGISSRGRHSPLPFRRQSATASVEEKYFTDTPQVDRHSVSIRQPLSSVRREQRHKQGMNIGNKCPDVSYSLSARQKELTEDEPMSAKVRFSPYVPSVRKPPTDGQNRKNKWEEKRGTSPPVGEYLQDQERRKSCQKASTSQKTSSMRYFRSSSSDSGAEDTDQEARKKPILSSDRKVSSRSPSSPLPRTKVRTLVKLGGLFPERIKALPVRLHLPVPDLRVGIGLLVKGVALLVIRLHENQVFHPVLLVVHQLKETMGLVLLLLLLTKVTRRQVTSVLGNIFSNPLSSMEPNPLRLSGLAFVTVQSTIVGTEKTD